jgi:hypothetical protein
MNSNKNTDINENNDDDNNNINSVEFSLSQL